MGTITGSGTILALAATIAVVKPAQSHLATARSLIPAAKHLVDTMPGATWAACLLLGHSSECLLRAAICGCQDDDPMRHGKEHHDLEALWARAIIAGLPLAASPSPWLAQLAALHRSPYQIRYPEKLNFIVLPSPGELLLSVEELKVEVERFLGSLGVAA
jgi:hypothetical protein